MVKIMRILSSFLPSKYTYILTFVVTVLLSVVTLAVASRIFYLSKTIIPLYEKKLQQKLEDQIVKIATFLDAKKIKAMQLVNDQVIGTYLEKNYLGEKISPSAQESFAAYIAKIQENADFESFSLIQGGTVVFSTNPLLRGVNLRDEKYSNTPLFRSYFISSMTLSTDFSAVLYSAIINEPAFYITKPVIKHKKVIGEIVYQIEEKELNAITRDYLDLGTTGEIVLAVQNVSQATFITPTRNDPSIRFTKEELFAESNFVPIQRAARGERGHGIELDYRGKETLSVWAFIPRVDWGIVVKIDLEEVNAPIVSGYKYLIFFAVLSSISLAFLAFLRRQIIAESLSKIRHKFFGFISPKVRLTEFFLLVIFIFLSVLSIYQYKHGTSSALKQSQDLAIRKVEKGLVEIENDLETIRVLGAFIAQDLMTERLISEDIRKRLRREIVETEGIVRITIAYAPHEDIATNKLLAPSIAMKEDGSIIEQQIGELYDYTDKKEGHLRTSWFTDAFETQKPQWVNPSIDPVSKERVITYSLPFYFNEKDKSPAGVIAIAYKLSRFVEIIQYIGVGKTGYAFIISSDQMFLHHPILRNVTEKKTLLQFAQEEGNKELEFIAREMQTGKSILKQFSDGSNTSSWIYTRPVNITGWTLATVFSTHEIGLPPSLIKDYIFNISIYLSITVLIVLLIICRFYAHNPAVVFFNFSNLILTIFIIILWYTISVYSGMENGKHVIITDQASVNKFITKQIQEAARKNEPIPIAIPCGIELYSLQQSNPINVSFSGYIWHRYHKTLHKDVQRIIRIPQATNFTVLSETKVIEGDWEIIGLNVTATIYHEHDYTYYPFEQHDIIIPLEHADIGKNILLVPDLAAYASINPRKLPGLDTTFSLTKFYTTETYFDYTRHKPNSDYGVRGYMDISDQYRLAYNAMISVELLAPFIFFFLPLLVILISIFAVLMLQERKTDPYTTIGPYTGLFFALVLLHRSLHEAAPATHTLYMEYAFFYTYIILILLVIHTIITQRLSNSNFYQDTVVYFYKIIFWPLQLIAWIITTLIIFY